MNVVAITPDRDHYITPIEPFLDYPLLFLRKPAWEELQPLNPQAVIFLGDWLFEQQELIKKCKKNRIPTILMMDGTIEWKHFFENPKWSYGGNEAPYFPVYCDKIFVPGESTLRFLNFFGNRDKCEVTGFPRLDHYANIKQSHLNSGRNKKTLGIMSGNTAGYTPRQIKESKQLFEDLYHWAKKQSDIDVLWRLRKGFEKVLDVEVVNDQAESLINFLEKVDAVICQPSTAAYEAMLCKIPVALADYNIAPNYMHAAWEIHSPQQIDEVIKDMFNPPPLKISLQQHLLDDNLAFCGVSSKLCAALINEMIKISEKTPSQELHYPTSMSRKAVKEMGIKYTQLEFPLFSNRTIYTFNENTILQEAYTKLENIIKKKDLQLRRRTIGFWMERMIRKITEK